MESFSSPKKGIFTIVYSYSLYIHNRYTDIYNALQLSLK